MLSVRSRYCAVEATSVQDRLHSLSNRRGLILDGGEDGNDAPPDDFFPLLVFLEVFLLPFFAIFFCSCFQSNPSNSAGLVWSNSDPLPPPAFPVSDGDDGENELVANAARHRRIVRPTDATDATTAPAIPPIPDIERLVHGSAVAHSALDGTNCRCVPAASATAEQLRHLGLIHRLELRGQYQVAEFLVVLAWMFDIRWNERERLVRMAAKKGVESSRR